MPEISRFYGIIIKMYWHDHNPPHFHAYYGNDAAAISMKNLKVIEGHIPRKAIMLVREWALQNYPRLLENWQLAMQEKDLKPIPPLE